MAWDLTFPHGDKNILGKCIDIHTSKFNYFVTFSTFIPQDDQLLEDSKTLGDCGFTNQTARPQAPATVGLAFRINGMFIFFGKFLGSGIICVFPQIR